jgi:hypothetical protein
VKAVAGRPSVHSIRQQPAAGCQGGERAGSPPNAPRPNCNRVAGAHFPAFLPTHPVRVVDRCRAARVLNFAVGRRDHREDHMIMGMLETILSWRSLVGVAVPPRTPTMTRMRRMTTTAATRTTIASRPLFENQTKSRRRASFGTAPVAYARRAAQ